MTKEDYKNQGKTIYQYVSEHEISQNLNGDCHHTKFQRSCWKVKLKSLRLGKIVPPMAGQNNDCITMTGVLMSSKMTTIKKLNHSNSKVKT